MGRGWCDVEGGGASGELFGRLRHPLVVGLLGRHYALKDLRHCNAQDAVTRGRWAMDGMNGEVCTMDTMALQEHPDLSRSTLHSAGQLTRIPKTYHRACGLCRTAQDFSSVRCSPARPAKVKALRTMAAGPWSSVHGPFLCAVPCACETRPKACCSPCKPVNAKPIGLWRASGNVSGPVADTVPILSLSGLQQFVPFGF